MVGHLMLFPRLYSDMQARDRALVAAFFGLAAVGLLAATNINVAFAELSSTHLQDATVTDGSPRAFLRSINESVSVASTFGDPGMRVPRVFNVGISDGLTITTSNSPPANNNTSPARGSSFTGAGRAEERLGPRNPFESRSEPGNTNAASGTTEEGQESASYDIGTVLSMVGQELFSSDDSEPDDSSPLLLSSMMDQSAMQQSMQNAVMVQTSTSAVLLGSALIIVVSRQAATSSGRTRRIFTFFVTVPAVDDSISGKKVMSLTRTMLLVLVVFVMSSAAVTVDPIRSAEAAVALSGSVSTNFNSSNHSSLGVSHTVPSGSDRLLLVICQGEGDQTDPNVSSVTYGAQSLTNIPGASIVGNGAYVEFWYLVNPPVGAATATCSYGGTTDNSGIVAISYTGVSQSNPFGNVGEKTAGNSSTPTFSLTTQFVNSVIVDAITGDGGDTFPHAPTSGQTERWDFRSGTSTSTDRGFAGGETATTSVGTYNLNWSQAVSDGYSIAAVEILPASPQLSISQPDGVSDTVTTGIPYDITYSLSDPDDDVTAAFYYDTNNSGFDGTSISGVCADHARRRGCYL